VSWYQKGKANLDFTEARDSEWQWHQLGRIQVCTSLQTDNHASTPTTHVFTGRMPFLPPNQQRQSTEGQCIVYANKNRQEARKRRVYIVHEERDDDGAVALSASDCSSVFTRGRSSRPAAAAGSGAGTSR